MTRGLILIVEDDRDYATILEDVLAHAGYEVQVCHTAAEAQAAVSQRIPDLALLDIVLPGVNGIELCSRIRRDIGAAAEVPILLMSGVYTRVDQVRQDMIFCGATDFLVKPIPQPTLLEKVEAYLQYEAPASMDGGADATEEFAIPPPAARSMEACPRSGRATPQMMASMLYRLGRDEFTGALRVEKDPQWRSVQFVDGVPVGAEGNIQDEELGTLVRTAQLLDRRSYNKVLAWVRKEQCSIARALLDGDFVDDEAYLGLLRLQVRTRVEGVIGMAGGTFSIRDGAVPSKTPLDVPLVPALLSGIRRAAPLAALEAEIAGYLDNFVRANRSFADHWKALAQDLGADPRPPILDGSRTLGEVVESRILSQDEMMRLVWVLLTCEALSLHGEGRFSAEIPMTIGADAVDTITLTEQAEAVIHAWLVHKDHDLYQIVGGSRRDLIRDLEVRFEQLDLGFDPEHLSSELPGDVRDMAATLTARVEEAREILLDPAQRKTFDARLVRREEVQEPPPSRKLEAKMLFAVGQRFVADKNFLEAQRAFTRAVERIPGSPEFKTHLGWATYRHATTQGLRDAAAQGLAFLEDAIREDRAFVLAHYFSGVIHREKGDLERAQNAFYLAVSYNPEFEPAKRALQEVRDAQREQA